MSHPGVSGSSPRSFREIGSHSDVERAFTPTRGHMDIGEGTWVPAFAGKTVGGGGVVYGNWRAYGYREDVGFGFRRTGGRGGGVYGNWRAYGRRGGDVGSGFRRKYHGLTACGGPRPHKGRGRGFNGFRRTGGRSGRNAEWRSGGCGASSRARSGSHSGRGGGVYGNWRAYGRRGGDVGFGFRRTGGRGGGVYGNWRAWIRL